MKWSLAGGSAAVRKGKAPRKVVAAIGIAVAGGVFASGPLAGVGRATASTGGPATSGAYLGGNSDDFGRAVAVDGSGNTYMAGTTASGTIAGVSGAKGGSDAFVVKIKPDGTTAYVAFVGGSGDDSANAVAVDALGRAWIAGKTSSIDLPLVGGAFATLRGDTDAFVAGLKADGSGLDYLTYLGGDDRRVNDFPPVNSGIDPSAFSDESGNGIAVDISGAVYVTGRTQAADFPVTPTAYQLALSSPKERWRDIFNVGGCATRRCPEAFLTKLNPSLPGPASLAYSTYFGGVFPDEGTAVAVDGAGKAYITGVAGASDEVGALWDAPFAALVGGNPAGPNPIDTGVRRIPTPGAYDGNGNADQSDAFVAKFDPKGIGPSSLEYAALLGNRDNPGTDIGWGIAVDSTGVYVAGRTISSRFPVTGQAYDGSCGDDPAHPCNVTQVGAGVEKKSDGFVSKLSLDGKSLLYSTYLGGDGEDQVTGIALDPTGERPGVVHVTGETDSSRFPSPPVPRAARGTDSFVVGLDTGLQKDAGLIYSGLIGGSSQEAGPAISIGCTGDAHLAGATNSSDLFPEAANRFNQGTWDAFAAKVTGLAPQPESCTARRVDLSVGQEAAPNSVAAGQELTYTITVGNAGPDEATKVRAIDLLDASVQFVSASQGCNEADGVVTCALETLEASGQAVVQVTVRPPHAGNIQNIVSVDSHEQDTDPSNNADTAVSQVNHSHRTFSEPTPPAQEGPASQPGLSQTAPIAAEHASSIALGGGNAKPLSGGSVSFGGRPLQLNGCISGCSAASLGGKAGPVAEQRDFVDFNPDRDHRRKPSGGPESGRLSANPTGAFPGPLILAVLGLVGLAFVARCFARGVPD